jgi:hypothetical protein
MKSLKNKILLTVSSYFYKHKAVVSESGDRAGRFQMDVSWMVKEKR